MAFNKILCAVDFSDCSRGALQAAVALKRQSDATLDVLFVYEVPHPIQPGLMVWMPEGPRALAEVAGKSYTTRLWEFIGSEGVQRDVTAHVVTDRPADGIVAFAEKHASDLIVVGTHGRTGLSRLLVGSVAARVIQRAPCPVLVIPESGQETRKPTAQASAAS
jgi:nucleotide-binding universal stress UspA family protein